MLALAGLVSGCAMLSHEPAAPPATRAATGGSYPYDPLVYHLDLSVLAYQVHAQSMIWPFDPFYEAVPGGERGRAAFMARVRAWAAAEGARQRAARPRLADYRGPGRLTGRADNPRLDPIVYRYDTLEPWRAARAKSGDRWVEYRPAAPIVAPVARAFVCHRARGRAPVRVDLAATNPAPRGRDVLLAFEGATGDKGEPGHPAAYGLLGYVLLRFHEDGHDIHVVFRGSRSGSLLRSVFQANWDSLAAGNPDWITDLGYGLEGPDVAGQVSRVGQVHRGFARAMDLTLPTLLACLDRAGRIAGSPPGQVTVTGHSLGGGLAQHFASAVLMGQGLGPGGQGPAMPRALRSWPWTTLKLISFSAPRAGDAEWARRLTEDHLQSRFHFRDIERYDRDALSPADPAIARRIGDPSRPAGFRVLASRDAVSTSAAPGRKPVGKTVYVDRLGPLAILAPYSARAHDPLDIRALMIAAQPRAAFPPPTWTYRDFAGPGPGAGPGAAVHEGLFADHAAFRRSVGAGAPAARQRDFEIFRTLLEGE